MNAAKEKTMSTRTVSYGEFEITVHPERNPLGAWIASVNVSHGARTIIDVRPKTVQPEWLTEEEAARDGVEFNTPEGRSWVAERAHAERWFRDAEEAGDSETSV
jgi:hypothetical protein